MNWRRRDLDEGQYPRTWKALRAGIDEGVAPGFVAGYFWAEDASMIHLCALGNRRVLPSVQPMATDTVFDLASLTKVFATASLMARLVERRWVEWETSLRAVLPAYPHAGIKLQHLLSHTAGLPAWAPLWEKLRARFAPVPLHRVPVSARRQAMREFLFSVQPECRVGERVIYSDLTFMLLEMALEEVTQMQFDEAVRRFVWEPMGLESARFTRADRSVEAGRLDFVAATEDCPWRGGVLQGQVHDDNAWAMGGWSGHAGAFANAFDVLKFAALWMRGSVVSSATRGAAWEKMRLPAGCERTRGGWDTPSGGGGSSSGSFFSEASVGHLGFTGTSLWVDLKRGLSVTLLSNRVHPSRGTDKIRLFRPRFHDALVQDLLAF